MFGHLPLTAAVAAMGAAMVSLVDHAHDGRTPAATAWVLGAGAAVVLGATMLVSASLQAWDRDRGMYRPLSRTCAVVAVACVGIAAVRPAPLLLGLALVALLSIPWGLAVARRLASPSRRVARRGSVTRRSVRKIISPNGRGFTRPHRVSDGAGHTGRIPGERGYDKDQPRRLS